MKDAGQSLRVFLKGNFQVGFLEAALVQFKDLQLKIAPHVDDFIQMGVPDWRLNQMPKLFESLLGQKSLLVKDGLSVAKISALKSLIPEVIGWCQELSNSQLKESIIQPDFHDSNVLIDEHTRQLTFVDLGEIVISHPLFSWIGFIFQVGKHHGASYQKTLLEALPRKAKY